MECRECLFDGLLSGIILMACLHGLLLAGIFFFNKQFNSKSNKFLALAILGVCIILCIEFIAWMEIEESIPSWIFYLPIYIRSTIPIGIFYFVLFLINPQHQLSPFEKVGFYALAIEAFNDLMFIPVNLFLEEESQIAKAEEYIVMVGWFFSIIVSLIFLSLALKKVGQYQQFLLNNYSNTHKRSLVWLRNFLLLVFGLSIVQIISFSQYAMDYEDAGEFSFFLITVGLVILLFWIGYALIIKYTWFQIIPIKESKGLDQSTHSKLSSKTNIYHDRLLQLLKEEKAYEDTDLTLDRLSEQLNISSGYLSQIINEKEGKNFFDLINFYRVQAVKKRLLDKEFANYTIMGIALECGFRSKSTFNAVFKKFTGQTPSSFKRMHV